jgi:hypothetical protein
VLSEVAWQILNAHTEFEVFGDARMLQVKPRILERMRHGVVVPGHGPVEHGRTTLNLFREYLTELNRLVREGVSAGKSLATLKAELAPERFHSLYNQDFGQTLQRNREALLGLPPGQPLEPVVSQGVEQVYYYYAQK